MTELPEIATNLLPEDYPRFLKEIKTRIQTARTQAALAVTATVLVAYWEIGNGILTRESQDGWGAKTLDRLAVDLRREFPDMKGLSKRNLTYMREFARAWPAASGQDALQNKAIRLPWGHHTVLLDRLRDSEERIWYAVKAAENGWSRKVLEAQIASKLRERQGAPLTSFQAALPAPDSELVRDSLKDPYNFEFLNLAADAKERELEDALLNDVQNFLMEMGSGFALVGRQFLLRVEDEATGEVSEFYLDLLFYNYVLRRFLVIDLKIEDFKPEFAGKMSFYLEAVDELVRQPGDEATIGLVLCPGRNETVTKWALRGTTSPVAVSRYTTNSIVLTEDAPSEMRESLPELSTLAEELSDLASVSSGECPERD